MKACLGYYVTLASTLIFPCLAGAQPSSVFQAFKQFLTNRPPIKEAEVDLSTDRFMAPERIKPSWPAFIPVRGAIQARGFYLQYPTVYPWQLRIVYGMSTSNYWSVDDRSVGFAALEGSLGASTNNADEVRAYNNKARLDRILLLGIEDAVPGSLQFTSETNFVARINRASGGELDGVFILDSAQVPVKAEYHDTHSPGGLKGEVSYVYSPTNPSFPPSQIILCRRDNRQSRIFTNIIHKLDIGIDSSAINGYSADMFLTPAAATRDIYIWSNGLRYLAASDGQLTVNMGTPLPDRAIRMAERIHERQRAHDFLLSGYIKIIAVILLLPAVFLTFKLWKREK